MSEMSALSGDADAGGGALIKKRSKASKRTSAEPLQRYLDEYSVTANQVDHAAGLSRGMCLRWLNEKRMPEYMRWVIEGMRRSARENRDKILIIKPGIKLDAVVTVLKAMGVQCQEL